MVTTTRACEVCLATRPRPIYRQAFTLFDDESGLDGYVVAACEHCGFVYADCVPGQDVYDRYYRDLSKYEAHESEGAISPWAAAIHRSIVSEVSARLPDRRTRILDVGAASGHLLSAFRDAGFERVVGFDPSARCSALARERYGVRVLTEPISEIALGGERFDLILLASVLEHLRDIDAAISLVRKVLAPGGAIWLEVPDAARFADFVHSPYHQFSLEHINFFTRNSLAGLMQRHGFLLRDCWETTRIVGSMPDPGLDAIFMASDTASANGPDTIGPREVQCYADRSEAFERNVCERLSALAIGGPFVIWGTGSLTLHLLTLDAFRRLNIAAFVDANVNYQGKSIGGVPVISPQAMRDRSEPILIVSHASEGAILAMIRHELRLPNPAFGLVSGSGT